MCPLHRINALAVSPTGARCISVSSDGLGKSWALSTMACEWILAGRGEHAPTEAGVNDIALSADGTLAVTASCDTTARLWDLRRQRPLHVLEGHEGWVVSGWHRMGWRASAGLPLNWCVLCTVHRAGLRSRRLAGGAGWRRPRQLAHSHSEALVSTPLALQLPRRRLWRL